MVRPPTPETTIPLETPFEVVDVGSGASEKGRFLHRAGAYFRVLREVAEQTRGPGVLRSDYDCKIPAVEHTLARAVVGLFSLAPHLRTASAPRSSFPYAYASGGCHVFGSRVFWGTPFDVRTLSMWALARTYGWYPFCPHFLRSQSGTTNSPSESRGDPADGSITTTGGYFRRCDNLRSAWRSRKAISGHLPSRKSHNVALRRPRRCRARARCSSSPVKGQSGENRAFQACA